MRLTSARQRGIMKAAGCFVLIVLCLAVSYHAVAARDVARAKENSDAGSGTSTAAVTTVTVTTTDSPVTETESEAEPEPDPEWEIVYSVWMEQLQKDLSDVWETA
ncbi:uncharacterized protein LOC119101591 [Pollicipes pollicipes]|uniref:uncharacterized protein LOC119101591 n=1 Tax=Pollicipes pollicipes TaxID=41117 RepID=UPI0018850373|nr:uncharacterized protein LOC119101591 [Pollicipes pollicipes]